MIALVLFVALLVWGAIGLWLWRTAVARVVSVRSARLILIVPFGATWFMAPVADELVGSRTFDEICRSEQRLEFHGPVSVGSGLLFDESGRPKWSTARQLQEMPIAQWSAVIVRSNEQIVLTEWPIPVVDQVTTHRSAGTGQLVAVAHYITSPGGWIRRLTGWGAHAPLACDVPVRYPPREKWIKFQ